MTSYTQRAKLKVDQDFANFIESEVLPGLSIQKDQFWTSMAAIVEELTPINMDLLARRDALQSMLDKWNIDHQSNFDAVAYKEFLREIAYLIDEGENFKIGTQNVDTEITSQAGPQLVVPTSNARFSLNASNARWGSLYDALYGSDAISEEEGAEHGAAYNPIRGAKVIAYARNFLDTHFALQTGSHTQATSYKIIDDGLIVHQVGGSESKLTNQAQCIAYQGDANTPSSILLKHHGLHVAIEIDADSPIGKTDTAGIKDLTIEAAITTIQDFEDSVAAVDAQDKIGVYRNWLGLMKGDLQDSFTKDGHGMTRTLAKDKLYTSLGGKDLVLHGRSLLFCRNVGHLMSNPAILDRNGVQIQEGIMDAVISVLIALHDIHGSGSLKNSRTGSVYIVKPKMHGPDEAAFANALFDRVEDEFDLPRHTIKIGVMDEERRTTVNLKECIRQVKDRVVFINTGFLDRTGDEIHSSMQLGAMAPKAHIKQLPWILAYEDWNVDIGLECGFPGKAQIGKGMWAMPDEMAGMLKAKKAHPLSGANTAWVPSPIGATLHAIHYHEVNVYDVQMSLRARPRALLDDILNIPLTDNAGLLSEEQIQNELDNNIQGILGYVVRWIDQGVGCSKVPDIDDVGLMEDRATLRISSQHICNWLLHKVCDETQVRTTFERMASVVDKQNSSDPSYRPLANNAATSLAYQAALDLVFKGGQQANGYTEPLLHAYRLKLKAAEQG